MTNLTEQQITDTFKSIPNDFNYCIPETYTCPESWYSVVDAKATQTMTPTNGVLWGCSDRLDVLLKHGAIKRPEPKEETNMKTTIDAVNEFKGEWATDDEMNPVTHIVMANINSGEHLKGELKVARGVNNDYWKVICSHEEFNNLVLRLSSNFGKSISYETYKQSWKETNMIYTQEMHDNGVLPSVGMRVIYNHCNPKAAEYKLKYHGKEVTIIAKVKDLFVLLSDNYDFTTICNGAWIKPLPTVKTELENGKAYQFNVRSSGRIINAIYNKSDNKLHVSDGQYFDVLSADSIKLLTVEG